MDYEIRTGLRTAMESMNRLPRRGFEAGVDTILTCDNESPLWRDQLGEELGLPYRSRTITMISCRRRETGSARGGRGGESKAEGVHIPTRRLTAEWSLISLSPSTSISFPREE